MARSFTLSCLLLAVISMGTVFFRLGGLPLIGADEPRYARIAQEMMQDQRWVTPTLEFKPWLEKPPLYYWITIPAYRLFGMNESGARFGPALLALISALVLYWLGAKLGSRLGGLMGAAILLSCVGFAAFARGASTDMPLTATLTAALAMLAAATVDEKLPVWKILFAYIFLGLSVLAKGPVALILAVGVLILFWLLDEHGGSFRRWHVFAGLAVAALVSLPWFWLAFRENGYAFIATFFVNHNLARYVTDIHHHEAPVYYYLPVLLGFFFPWSGWLLTLVPDSVRSRLRAWRSWDRPTLFLLCWAAFPLLFFSFSLSKLSGYILPSVPPLALLLGFGIAKAAGGERRVRYRVSAAWLTLVLSFCVSVAAVIAFQERYGGTWQTGASLVPFILLPAAAGFYFMIKARWQAAFISTLGQGTALVLAIAWFAFPVLGEYHSTREIARQALASDKSGEPIATFLYFHHTLDYYTGYRISEDLQDLDSVARFSAKHDRFLLVTKTDLVPHLLTLSGLSVREIGGQADLRLLELKRRQARF